METNKTVRNDRALLDSIYNNLMTISDEIQQHPDNAKLIDSFDSLVATYFDIEEDGGF